jgi:hypothetical protein
MMLQWQIPQQTHENSHADTMQTRDHCDSLHLAERIRRCARICAGVGAGADDP